MVFVLLHHCFEELVELGTHWYALVNYVAVLEAQDVLAIAASDEASSFFDELLARRSKCLLMILTVIEVKLLFSKERIIEDLDRLRVGALTIIILDGIDEFQLLVEDIELQYLSLISLGPPWFWLDSCSICHICAMAGLIY